MCMLQTSARVKSIRRAHKCIILDRNRHRCVCAMDGRWVRHLSTVDRSAKRRCSTIPRSHVTSTVCAQARRLSQLATLRVHSCWLLIGAARPRLTLEVCGWRPVTESTRNMRSAWYFHVQQRQPQRLAPNAASPSVRICWYHYSNLESVTRRRVGLATGLSVLAFMDFHPQ
jgi:hypothetical protein